jgi:hypothetical protein
VSNREHPGPGATAPAATLRRLPPREVARFLTRLGWRALADAARDGGLSAVVRRRAEDELLARVADLTLGERVSLARRATARIARALIGSIPEPAVLRSLLGNPRLVLADAVRLASDARAPREVLVSLAEHPRWGAHREVRFALVAHGRTPIATSLAVLATLA